jgi:hypothetical protein
VYPVYPSNAITRSTGEGVSNLSCALLRYTGYTEGAEVTGRAVPGFRREYWNYLLSPQWAERRQAVLDRAGGRCERCGTEAERLEVHHLHYRTIFRETPEDLQAVCRPCHAQEHGVAA